MVAASLNDGSRSSRQGQGSQGQAPDTLATFHLLVLYFPDTLSVHLHKFSGTFPVLSHTLTLSPSLATKGAIKIDTYFFILLNREEKKEKK